jgi:hypothetical protein
MSASFQAQLHAAWGWADNVPAGCPECRTEWQSLYRYIARAHPDRAMSLITSLEDHSIGAYFRLAGPQMHSALDALADELTLPLFRVFYIAGSDHVWLSRDLASVRTAGLSLAEFLTAQLTRAPTWRSARPDRLP